MARPDASAARTRQILDAAAAVFARLGLHQARIEDIAAEAGLSKGLVYRYFSSKDALVVALVDGFYGEALAQLHAMDGGTEPIADQLAQFTDHTGTMIERIAPLLPMTFEFYAAALRRPDVAHTLNQYYAEYRTVARALFQRGIERGEFRGRSSDDAAEALIALYEGTTVLWALDQAGTAWVARAQLALQLILDGMRGGNPPTP